MTWHRTESDVVQLFPFVFVIRNFFRRRSFGSECVSGKHGKCLFMCEIVVEYCVLHSAKETSNDHHQQFSIDRRSNQTSHSRAGAQNKFFVFKKKINVLFMSISIEAERIVISCAVCMLSVDIVE